jgi:hypothetical protein
MRRVVVVHRHLHRELAAVGEGAGQAREQLRVVGQPLQGGVGEDHVVGGGRGEGGDVGALEAQAGRRKGGAVGEHGLGAVDAGGVGVGQAIMQGARQLAGAAAEIDDAQVRARFDQRDQVQERLPPLAAEAVVLGRVPGAGGHRHEVVAPSRRSGEGVRPSWEMATGYVFRARRIDCTRRSGTLSGSSASRPAALAIRTVCS